MVAQMSRRNKLESLDESFTELKAFVIEAARVGQAEHVVEEKLFRELLRLGKMLLGEFFSGQGTGDLGETVTLPDGRQVRRLPVVDQLLEDRVRIAPEGRGRRVRVAQA